MKWKKVGDIMLIGEYHHNIDEKGRLIIPSKFREDIGNEFVVTRGLDGCLFVYAMKEWNAIGFVPFKEKDRLYKEFHALVDKLFDRLHLSATEKRLSSVRTNGNKEGNLYRDRERLVRTYEGLKNDIQTYENNLGFLNSSSKKGNTLVADITRKIERLKKDMELVLKKIKDIDESLKEKE